jgi:hypothetical protein
MVVSGHQSVWSCLQSPRDFGDDESCNWRERIDPATVAVDPSPGWFRVERDVVVGKVNGALRVASESEVQPYLWPENDTDTSPRSGRLFDNSITKRTLGWGNFHGEFFVSNIPTSTGTGVLRQHGTRINSTASCFNVTKSEFPSGCAGNAPFVFEYKGQNLTVRVCVPGDTGVSPWNNTRSRTDVREELFIDVDVIPNSMDGYGYWVESFTTHCTASTAKGAFELPNSQNNYTKGPLLAAWPSKEILDAEFDDIDYLYSQQPGDADNYPLTPPNRPYAPGPLAATAIALFGNGTFLHGATGVAGSGGPLRAYIDAFCTGANDFPLTRLWQDDDSSFRPTNNPFGSPAAYCTSASYPYAPEEVLYAAVGGFGDLFWANTSLLIGMYAANVAVLQEATLLGMASGRSRPIFTAPGHNVVFPTVGAAARAAVSALIGLQVLAVLGLLGYATAGRAWSARMDGAAAARMGAAMEGAGLRFPTDDVKNDQWQRKRLAKRERELLDGVKVMFVPAEQVPLGGVLARRGSAGSDETAVTAEA